MTSILIGLTRLPRVFLLGAIALNFGISVETDTFFLIYSIALFLVATVSYTNEVLAPGKKSFVLGTLASVIVLIGTFLFTESILALFLIAYVISSSIVSTTIGKINREQNYVTLGHSVLPYLIATPIIAFIPENIYLLSTVLTLVEVIRLIIVRKHIAKIFGEIGISWKYSTSMIAAVAVGGCTPIILKLFAVQMEPGTVSILAYTFGAVFPIANALSYGVSVDKINRISTHISILPSLAVTLLLVIASVVVLFSPFWIKDLAIPVIVFSTFIPLSVLSSIKRAYFIVNQDNKELFKASCLATLFLTIGTIFVVPFEIYGLLTIMILAQAFYLAYLVFKLRQQNYFDYHIYKNDSKVTLQEGD